MKNNPHPLKHFEIFERPSPPEFWRGRSKARGQYSHDTQGQNDDNPEFPIGLTGSTNQR